MKVPAKMAWYILLFFKLMTEKYGLIKHNHSMSAHYIQLASHTRTFDCTAARNQIGYSPVVSLQVSHSFIFVNPSCLSHASILILSVCCF